MDNNNSGDFLSKCFLLIITAGLLGMISAISEGGLSALGAKYYEEVAILGLLLGFIITIFRISKGYSLCNYYLFNVFNAGLPVFAIPFFVGMFKDDNTMIDLMCNDYFIWFVYASVFLPLVAMGFFITEKKSNFK